MVVSTQSDGYMGLPHRRPPVPINAPALVRHVGYRIPDTNATGQITGRYQQAINGNNQVIAAINATLIDLQSQFCSTQRIFRASGDDQTNAWRINSEETLINTLDKLEGEFSEWRVRLLVDLHPEYYFVTFILDQRQPHETARRVLEEELKLSNPGFDRNLAAKFLEDYYDVIWDRFEEDVVQRIKPFPGERVAQLCGLALRDAESRFSQKPGMPPQTLMGFASSESEEFSQARFSLHAWLRRNQFFLEKFLNVYQLDAGDQDPSRILCEMMDGAAIFAMVPNRTNGTAEQPDVSGNSTGVSGKSGPAARYFILYNGLSRNQLGSMVMGIHAVEEARFAATIDLDLVHAAGKRLRALAAQFDSIQAGSSIVQNTNPEDVPALVRQQIEAISKQVPTGLETRISRSRRCEGLMRDRQAILQVLPLDGWQSYREFAQCNLDQALAEIDHVLKQLETLRARTDHAIGEAQTRKLVVLQQSVVSLSGKVEEFDRHATTRTAHALGRIQGELSFLQDKLGRYRRYLVLSSSLAVIFLVGNLLGAVLWSQQAILRAYGLFPTLAERFPSFLDWVGIAMAACAGVVVFGLSRLLRPLAHRFRGRTAPVVDTPASADAAGLEPHVSPASVSAVAFGASEAERTSAPDAAMGSLGSAQPTASPGAAFRTSSRQPDEPRTAEAERTLNQSETVEVAEPAERLDENARMNEIAENLRARLKVISSDTAQSVEALQVPTTDPSAESPQTPDSSTDRPALNRPPGLDSGRKTGT